MKKFIVLISIAILAISCNYEEKDWEILKQSENFDDYFDYAAKYPDSKYIFDTEGKVEISYVDHGMGAEGFVMSREFYFVFDKGKFEIMTTHLTDFVGFDKQREGTYVKIGQSGIYFHSGALYKVKGIDVTSIDQFTSKENKPTILITYIELITPG